MMSISICMRIVHLEVSKWEMQLKYTSQLGAQKRGENVKKHIPGTSHGPMGPRILLHSLSNLIEYTQQKCVSKGVK